MNLDIKLSFNKKIKALQILNHLLIIPCLYYENVFWWLLGLGSYIIVEGCGVSVGLHRYFSHRSFKTNFIFEFLLLFLGTVSTLGSTIAWVGVHRKHHSVSDKEGDPHSPLIIGFFRSYVGYWPRFDVSLKDVKDLSRNKYHRFFHKNYFKIIFLWCLILFAINPLLVLFVYCLPAVGSFHAAAMVNTICHKLGYRNFPTKDHSQNNLFVALITCGEGYHNNHHQRPNCYNFSKKWWELDLGALFVKLIKIK